MSTGKIAENSQVGTIQELSNVNNAEGIKQNTKSNTSIHKFFQTSSPRSFSKAQNTKPRNIQDALANSYGLSKTDAQNIESAVNALQKHLDSISTRQAGNNWEIGMKLQENIDKSADIKNNFFTKLKTALAKLVHFFGSDSKLKNLQDEGLRNFNDIKTLLTEDAKGKEFLVSFIEGNADNKDVMDGLCKMLGVKTEHLDENNAKNYLTDFKNVGNDCKTYFENWGKCFQDDIFDEEKIEAKINESQLYKDGARNGTTFNIDFKTSYGDIKSPENGFNLNNIKDFKEQCMSIIIPAFNNNDNKTINAIGGMLARVESQGYQMIYNNFSSESPQLNQLSDITFVTNGTLHMDIKGEVGKSLTVDCSIQGLTETNATMNNPNKFYQHTDVKFKLTYPFDSNTNSYNSVNGCKQEIEKVNIDIYGIAKN